VGPAADRLDALLAFHAAADAACASPAVYSASAALLPQLIELGYAVRKIGEVAHIDAAQFTLEGPARARLRQTWNRFKRDGWRIEVVPPGGAVDWAALKSISDDWLAAHGGHEKSFSLGRFDADYLTRFPIAIAAKDGEPPAAFSSLWPSADKGEIGIDLMRHRSGTPSGLMDILFIGLIEWARVEGYRIVDLGMTPLAGISRARYAPSMNKIGAAIYEHGEDLYGFKGLRSYKSKFAPDWQPVFIGAPGYVSLPIALAQAAILTSGGLKGLFAK
jgi:phosphatidylglycerol lysyltransferase